MRYWSRVVAAVAVAACTESAPSTQPITGENVALLASVASEEAPPIVFNAQMRSDIEVPACATESQGHAQIKIFQDGRIESTVILNNKGDESVRFGHIHHLNPGAGTGPIIWVALEPRRRGPQSDGGAHRRSAGRHLRRESAFRVARSGPGRVAGESRQLLRQFPFRSLPRRDRARVPSVGGPARS